MKKRRESQEGPFHQCNDLAEIEDPVHDDPVPPPINIPSTPEHQAKTIEKDDASTEIENSAPDDSYRLQRNRNLPKYLKEFETYSCINGEPGDPTSVQEAMERADWTQWKKAMDQEYQSQMDNHTWILTDLPPGNKALNCKWVFRTKRDASGKIVKQKARLVVKGCAQKKGVNYDETFSPVVRYSSIRYLLALAAEHDFDINQMDAVGVFLQGDLKNEMHMLQPEGYNSGNKVCELLESNYGLIQASRIRN